MAYTISLSNRFKKDFRRCIKRGLNMKHITDAMDLLESTGTPQFKGVGFAPPFYKRQEVMLSPLALQNG